jgi:hypothetical protein
VGRQLKGRSKPIRRGEAQFVSRRRCYRNYAGSFAGSRRRSNLRGRPYFIENSSAARPARRLADRFPGSKRVRKGCRPSRHFAGLSCKALIQKPIRAIGEFQFRNRAHLVTGDLLPLLLYCSSRGS